MAAQISLPFTAINIAPAATLFLSDAALTPEIVKKMRIFASSLATVLPDIHKMMMSRTRKRSLDDIFAGKTQKQCAHADCSEAGEFRAPKTRMLDRGGPEDYQWFCLVHIREFNKAWNFFAGMSDEEILRYRTQDITGHRPTWKLGSRTATLRADHSYHDPFNLREEMAGVRTENGSAETKSRVSLDPKARAALATLNLEPGSSLEQIKRRHKELAKKYHPDIRGGDKKAEEILKNINQAYTHLRSCANS